MDENNKRHVMEKGVWLSEKTVMEAKFIKDLEGKDAQIAEEQRLRDQRIQELTKHHNQKIEEARAHEAASIASLLAEHHVTQARWLAQERALKDEMVATLAAHEALHNKARSALNATI